MACDYLLTLLSFITESKARMFNLLPFVTESKAVTVSYKPQCVLRQLGYNQSAIQVMGEMGCSNNLAVESHS